jgi:hypothetical protein
MSVDCKKLQLDVKVTLKKKNLNFVTTKKYCGSDLRKNKAFKLVDDPKTS